MLAQVNLAIRKEELRRRVEALPKEIDVWKARTTAEVDKNVHFSQLNAIGVLMETLVERQNDWLEALNPDGAPADFEASSFELIKLIIKSQRVWDFFRDKLDLRFSPAFKDVLWVADTIAWDCYRPILDLAADNQILSRFELREPPLTYLTAEFSPATWVRGSRPNDGRNYDLGTATLPIPVIQLPWDHVKNIWEFLSLHHEVGHDLEADLKLRTNLLTSLRTELSKVSINSRIDRWISWEGEIIADLIGLQLAGPAFTDALMHLLLLPVQMVTTLDEEDPHPTPYLRVLMNIAYIHTISDGWKADSPQRQILLAHAHRLRDLWLSLYDEQSQFSDYLEDFPHVFKALMDTPFDVLGGETLRQLMPFTGADDKQIRDASQYLLTGRNAPIEGALRPRHCISAARLAVGEAALQGGSFEQYLEDINVRTEMLVHENAPKGLRGGDDSVKHKTFIASFVENF